MSDHLFHVWTFVFKFGRREIFEQTVVFLSTKMATLPRPSTYLRGDALLREFKLHRYIYLKERTALDVWKARQQQRKRVARQLGCEASFTPEPQPPLGAPSRPFLLQPYGDPALKWAPRDSMDHACASMEEWLSHGYGDFHVPLSLIGYGSDKPDFAAVRKVNSFVTGGFTYLHMAFSQLASFIQRLHPSDRFLCYLIPSGVPVHMYFDLDGDFARFPHLVGREEQCLNEFLKEVRLAFLEEFKRPLDSSRLVLLEATSAVKMSWHVHVQSEAFRDVYHLQAFVKCLNRRLERKAASGDASLLIHEGRTLVDHVPYMANQNFRAPYNRKPTKTTLMPRCFRLEEGRIVLLPTAIEEVIDQELLWRCHPALAQPSGGYTYLQLQLPDAASKKRRRTDVLTTDNRAMKMKKRGDGMLKAKTMCKTVKVHHALPGSVRPLTSDEWDLVTRVLQTDLGATAGVYDATWYRTIGGEVCVQGTCIKASACCLSQRKLLGSDYIHKSNSMSFSLSSRVKSYRCFKCDIRGSEHRLDWDWTVMGDAINVRQLLDVTPIGSDAEEEVHPTDRRKRLVEYVNGSVGASRQYDIFDVSKWRQDASAREAKNAQLDEFRLFKQVMFHGENRAAMDKVEQFERYWRFKEELEASKKHSQWKEVVQIDERFLDATKDSRIQHAFNKSNHIVIQSAQGTGKTDLILTELARLKQSKPDLRVGWFSLRIAYSETLLRRANEFADHLQPDVKEPLRFRSYKEFRMPKIGNGGEGERQAAKIKAATVARELVQCNAVIISLESLHRLTEAKTVSGELLLPQYDVLVMDEIMEIHAIFHGGTMQDLRKSTLEILTSLVSSARHVIAADADVKDEIILPFLHDLSGGARFSKLLNVQQTIKREYVNYGEHSKWRKALLHALQSGKKVVVACTTKSEALSIRDDPDIKALELSMMVVHGESTSIDRSRFVNQVQNWTGLTLFVYSPVIACGVDFNEVHFDVAFLFASDNSTTVRQAFQQLNRTRRLADDRVHMFLSVHEAQHRHLPCTYDEIEAQLNEQIREHHGDLYIQRTSLLKKHSTPLNLEINENNYGNVRPPPGRNGTIPESNVWSLDSGIPPGEYTRKLFDTASNRMFIRNQLEINRSQVHFREDMFAAMRDAGGIIIELRDSAEDDAKEYAKELRERAVMARKERQDAIMQAEELPSREVEEVKSRLCRSDIREGDHEALLKAKWKEVYEIPLDDSERLAAIPEFAERFGSDTRLSQMRNLKILRQECMSTVHVELANDPVGYLVKEHELRKHVRIVLDSIGCSSIWSSERMDYSEQEQLTLGERRTSILKRLNECNWEYSAWWKNWKTVHSWSMENEDVVDAGGVRVGDSVLFDAFVSGARSFLKGRLGINVARGRYERRGVRCSYLQLDRSHWNEWSEVLKCKAQEDAPIGRKRRSAGAGLESAKYCRKRSTAHEGNTSFHVSDVSFGSDDGMDEGIRRTIPLSLPC